MSDPPVRLVGTRPEDPRPSRPHVFPSPVPFVSLGPERLGLEVVDVSKVPSGRPPGYLDVPVHSHCTRVHTTGKSGGRNVTGVVPSMCNGVLGSDHSWSTSGVDRQPCLAVPTRTPPGPLPSSPVIPP